MSRWTEFRTVRDIEIEKAGRVRFLTAEVSVTLERVPYGSDADGRRGIVRDEITDWTYESIFDLETGNDVTDEFENDYDLKQIIGEAI